MQAPDFGPKDYTSRLKTGGTKTEVAMHRGREAMRLQQRRGDGSGGSGADDGYVMVVVAAVLMTAIHLGLSCSPAAR